MKGTVVHINGGLGKCIVFTGVAKCYKEQNPDQELIIVSGYPEVFIHNPNVDGNYSFNTPELWTRFYGNPEYEVLAQDPYLEAEWIKNEEIHLMDIWCDMLGIDCTCNGPELFFSGPEVDDLQAMIQTDKPLVVVQSTGGSNPAARSWTRNPSKAELDQYLERYAEDNYVVHLCTPDTPVLNNVHQRIDSFTKRQAMCLVYYAYEFVGIDSFGLHARAANPEAGATTIFLPLAESRIRLGYDREDWNWLVPTQEVQDLLKDHTDYYATVFKLSIDDASENCPVPAGVRWFEF